MYRICRCCEEPVDAATLTALMSLIESSQPGRYPIDEIGADPRQHDRAAQRWGVGVKWADGSVEIEHDTCSNRIRLAELSPV